MIFCLQFFRTTLTGKQIIALPLSKDDCTTYHQGEVSIPYKQSLKVCTHFYRKPLSTAIIKPYKHNCW